jgi:Na+/proline symporter
MESSWRRACRDTESFRKDSRVWFWGVEIVGGGALFGLAGSLLGDYYTPSTATPFWQSAYPTIGGAIGVILGFIIVFALIYVVNLLRAPYRQRDEARIDVEQLMQV